MPGKKKKPQIVICDVCGNHIPIKRPKPARTFKETKAGKRKDLGDTYFRSAWEANIARYLNWLKKDERIKKWFYESKRFQFPVKTGTRSYLPDFCVVYNNDTTEWWEVKGYLTKKGKTAIKRFGKYYPDERLRIIQRKEYEEIKKKFSGKIPNWED